MLDTEKRNDKTTHIDRMSVGEMLLVMQSENEYAVKAVETVIPQIEKAVSAIEVNMKKGGRLFYVGCGTSGRLGVLDASECPPTYGVSPDLVVGIIAGGDKCLRNASENAEDLGENGIEDIKKYKLTKEDSVVGISAAGGAEYVVKALEFANRAGCVTVSITCNRDTKMSRVAGYSIEALTGPEVVTGSTRMKAGTAQKLILNMMSTALMIRMGYVYENLMINLRPSNIKLRNRMVGIVCSVLGCGEEKAKDYLDRGGWVIKNAIELAERENSENNRA